MNESLEFTSVFLRKYPGQAAKVLESLPVEETAKFLDEIPVETGALVAERLSPQYAAQCLMISKSETTLGLLQNIKTVTGVSFLRLFPYSSVKPWLKNLPQDKNSEYKKRLSYPQDSVGAWMDSNYPTLPEGITVGQARSLLRNSGKSINHSLCVLREDGTVAGLLLLSKLLVAVNKTDLSKIITLDRKPVLDQASLLTLASKLKQEDFDTFAVTNRKGNYLGVLTRIHLENGLKFAEENHAPEQTDSIVLDVVKTYASTLSGLVQSILSSRDSGQSPSR